LHLRKGEVKGGIEQMGIIQFIFFIFFLLVYFGITGLIIFRLFGREERMLVKE
jgi:hypothetical protein